jgi:hypothetical protein
LATFQEVIVSRRTTTVLCLLHLIGGLPSHGAEVRTLFQAEVVVSSKDEGARDQDIRRALQLVLGRTISPTALASRGAGAILDKAVNYVLSYEYASRPASDPSSVRIDLLRVNFDQPRLTDALRRKGISAWGEQRPELLLWLAVGDVRRQEWFLPELMPEIDRQLRFAADQKGLPYALPLLDLADQQSLSIEDIRSGADEPIRTASARYEATDALAGRLSRTDDNGWEAVWRLYPANAAPTAWQGQYNSLAEAMQAGFDGAYAKLSERYIPAKPQGETRLELRVTGVSSLAEVSKVANYLGSLSLIKSVEWLRVEPNQAVFRLVARGDRTSLEQAFALGRMLRPAEGDGFRGMNYQLQQQ